MSSARSANPKPAVHESTYTISELAREFALTTRAIRFYEDEGLIAPARQGRARVYGERERVRLKLVLRGKRLGLALAEIAELLDLYEIARNEGRSSRSSWTCWPTAARDCCSRRMISTRCWRKSTVSSGNAGGG